MHRAPGPGQDNPMDEGQGANKPSEQEHTTSGNVITRYHRLLHRRSASLDLEAAFKKIKISQDIKPELCEDCKTEKCKCPAFTPETPCSSAPSMPTKPDTDDEEISELVKDTPMQVLYPLTQSQSDKEADQEVSAICSAPVYYRVRSLISC